MGDGDRRLSAIMFTDMVGFTSLSQRNEALALDLLEEQRRLVRSVLSKHRGREVKTIGDAFLVEFSSALEAARCAFEIQRTMKEAADSAPPERKVSLRIGVHVGDVVGSGGDIHGDAVNVASRVEPLSEPDGVCLTEEVYLQVRNKLEVPLQPLGEQKLKNVDAPLKVYRMVMPWARQTPEPAASPRTRIAVLPFSNISPDPADAYFADGMTEELINTISHNQKLKVIARTSVGRYKGSQKSASEIGKEIGVGSILEGSVRKAGSKVRVTAQLIDAATEEHMWSDNYDRELNDVFVIQSEIAKSVSEALTLRLLPVEKGAVEKQGTRNPAAHVHYLKGRIAMRERSAPSLEEAREQFEQAIELDPRYAEAHSGLADSLFLLAVYGHMPMPEALTKGKEAVEKALAINDSLPEAHTTFANYHSHEYRFAEAEAGFKRAISLNRNYLLAHHWYSILLLEEGRVEEALDETLEAEELDPLSPVIAYNLAIANARLGNWSEAEKDLVHLRQLEDEADTVSEVLCFFASIRGDYQGAVAHAERSLQRNPSRLYSNLALGLCAAAAGDVTRAKRAQAWLEALPDTVFAKQFHIAVIRGALGERDEMFRMLDKAFEDKSIEFRHLRFWYSMIDPDIQKDPRYVALFERAGLTP